MGGAVMGYEATCVYFDEAANIDQRVHDALRDKAETQARLAKRRIVDPLEIVCARCKAVAGERCTDTNRRKTFERKPHRRRKDDARRAQEAVNAML